MNKITRVLAIALLFLPLGSIVASEASSSETVESGDDFVLEIKPDKEWACFDTILMKNDAFVHLLFRHGTTGHLGAWIYDFGYTGNDDSRCEKDVKNDVEADSEHNHRDINERDDDCCDDEDNLKGHLKKEIKSSENNGDKCTHRLLNHFGGISHPANGAPAYDTVRFLTDPHGQTLSSFAVFAAANKTIAHIFKVSGETCEKPYPDENWDGRCKEVDRTICVSNYEVSKCGTLQKLYNEARVESSLFQKK